MVSESPHYIHFKEVLPQYGVLHIGHSHNIYPIIGVLNGAPDDLQQGYLIGQEFLIAGDVFDSILEQAEELVHNKYKDPAAVLARVVIENTLRKLAKSESIDDTLKASAINDELKKKGRLTQPQWRYAQAWLDIGNAAAHGEFDKYALEDVSTMIQSIRQFIALEFHE